MERTRTTTVPRWLDVATAWGWRLLLLAVALAIVAIVLRELQLLVVPLLVSVFVAALLMPLVDRLDRTLPGPRTIPTVIVLIAAIALIVGIVMFLVPRFAEQAEDLVASVQQGITQVETWLDDRFGISLRQAADQVIGEVDGAAVRDQVVTGAVLIAEVVAGLLLAIVLAFFVLRDGPRFSQWAKRQVAPERREVASAIGRRGWGVIGGYLRGVMITGGVDAIAIGIGLVIIGVPLVFGIMVLTFFGAFFPLVGAFLAGTVAVLVALVSLGLTEALLTLAVVIGVQQLESDVVAPIVLGRTLQLHPVVILFALTIGALTAGIVGAAFAVPLAAVLRAALDEMRKASDGDDPGDGSAGGDPDVPEDGAARDERDGRAAGGDGHDDVSVTTERRAR